MLSSQWSNVSFRRRAVSRAVSEVTLIGVRLARADGLVKYSSG